MPLFRYNAEKISVLEENIFWGSQALFLSEAFF